MDEPPVTPSASNLGATPEAVPRDPPDPRPAHAPAWSLEWLRARTPARVFVGRAGSAYRTEALLDLRRDHAAALDAVHLELEIARDLGPALTETFGLFEIRTKARSKAEYLMRPDLGRSFDESAVPVLSARGTSGADLQVAIADGLSARAVAVQVPPLLPLLEAGARARGWRFGQVFVVRHGRVGILNEIGEFLKPVVAVLLIGERPGLATAESLSAYMAFRPCAGHTDAQRNLVSNIHAHGLPPDIAAGRILDLASAMIAAQASGVALQEPGIPSDPPITLA